MIRTAVSVMARVAKDPASRLVALGVALALTLSGVTRSFLEMASWGVGTFPMPGDNLLMLGACVLVCAVACRAHRALARAVRTRAGQVGVCAFAFACVALLDACHFLPAEAGAGLLFFAGALVRVAGLVALMALYACVGPRPVAEVVAQMAWGLATSIALDCVFLLLAPAGVAIVGLAVPLALGGVLFALTGVLPRAKSPACAASAPDGGEHTRVRLPWARLATFCLYGVVGGLASSQSHTLGSSLAAPAPSLAHSCLVNDLGLVLGAALLLLGTLALARRVSEPFSLRYLLLPAYLVVIFLSPLLSGVLGTVVPVLMALSQALFYGLLWAFPTPAPAGERLRWFSAACGSFFAGTYAGMFVGGDLLPAMDAGDVYMVVAAVALAALLMMELAPRVLGARPGEAAPDVPAVPEAPVPPEPAPAVEAALGIDALAELAADAWGLTPRERAVLPGLLRGRSVAWVASSLTVSKNTVHTHMRNIYQKAGVHSQEELIDAAEGLGGGR